MVCDQPDPIVPGGSEAIAKPQNLKSGPAVFFHLTTAGMKANLLTGCGKRPARATVLIKWERLGQPPFPRIFYPLAPGASTFVMWRRVVNPKTDQYQDPYDYFFTGGLI